MQRSHTVLKKAINKVGVKALAAKLGVSQTLVYKWCQPSVHEESPDLYDVSGAQNPLDRLRKVYEYTKDPEIINWICKLADGYYVKNPTLNKKSHETVVVKNTQKLIKEFSETLAAISTSYSVDKKITAKEAKVIRKEWEDLKRIGEGFVKACEMGKFDK